MANMAARTIHRTPEQAPYNSVGDFAGMSKKLKGPDFIGPAWFTEGMKDVY